MPSELGHLVVHGLVWGAIAGAALSVIFLTAARVNPEVMLRGYPPDIRAAYGPMSSRARLVALVAGLLAALAVGGGVAGAFATMGSWAGVQPDLIPGVVTLAALVVGLNLVDLLFLDWLVFVTLRPSFVVLPGTEGMPGYRDYGFHLAGFVKGSFGGIGLLVLVGAAYALSRLMLG